MTPALEIPVASARSFFGNHSATALTADGKWDLVNPTWMAGGMPEQLDEFFHRVVVADLAAKVHSGWKMLLRFLGKKIINPQRRSKALEIGKRHYDTYG